MNDIRNQHYKQGSVIAINLRFIKTDHKGVLTMYLRLNLCLHVWAFHLELSHASLDYWQERVWEYKLYRTLHLEPQCHWTDTEGIVGIVVWIVWSYVLHTYSDSSVATGHLYWAVLKRQISAYWRTVSNQYIPLLGYMKYLKWIKQTKRCSSNLKSSFSSLSCLCCL